MTEDVCCSACLWSSEWNYVFVRLWINCRPVNHKALKARGWPGSKFQSDWRSWQKRKECWNDTFAYTTGCARMLLDTIDKHNANRHISPHIATCISLREVCVCKSPRCFDFRISVKAQASTKFFSFWRSSESTFQQPWSRKTYYFRKNIVLLICL